MKLYVVTGLPESVAEGGHVYTPTLSKAHVTAQQAGATLWGDARIEQVEVATDQQNVLRLLNGEGGFQSEPARTWALSRRGGLVEIQNGE
jgi:hypothetical protein